MYFSEKYAKRPCYNIQIKKPVGSGFTKQKAVVDTALKFLFNRFERFDHLYICKSLFHYEIHNKGKYQRYRHRQSVG